MEAEKSKEDGLVNKHLNKNLQGKGKCKQELHTKGECMIQVMATTYFTNLVLNANNGKGVYHNPFLALW
jgi:hypothetical protein